MIFFISNKDKQVSRYLFMIRSSEYHYNTICSCGIFMSCICLLRLFSSQLMINIKQVIYNIVIISFLNFFFMFDFNNISNSNKVISYLYLLAYEIRQCKQQICYRQVIYYRLPAIFKTVNTQVFCLGVFYLGTFLRLCNPYMPCGNQGDVHFVYIDKTTFY